jgi:phosphonate transport system substrate-binding protein
MIMLLLTGLASGRQQEQSKAGLQTGGTPESTPAASQQLPLRIGMGAMITPKEGYVYYLQLKRYLEEKLHQPVQLIDRDSYKKINALLRSGGIDAAFVCAGPYVEGHREFGLELLAMPLADGKPVYYSYIIVHRDSPITELEGLRGKSFAFADPESNTGKIVPMYMLALMQETPASFFGNYVYTYGHDKSIKAVALQLVDGAAVDSLIWEYANRTNPEYTAKTRIIRKSSPYGIPPVVVRPGLAAATKQHLQEILLHMHEDQKGRQILQGMMLDRFVTGDDKNYDSIRAMLKQPAPGQRSR